VRLLISGGGTGGHVYPALAVVDSLSSHQPAAICWIGSEGGVEQDLVKRAGLTFEAIPAGGLHGLAPWTAARNVVRLARGFARSLAFVTNWKPDVLFVTGGFVSVPVALACWLRRVPILVFLPDIEPAWAIKFLGRLATRITVTAEASRKFLPAHKITVTGYPLRRELIVARGAKDRALVHFGLQASRKTILFAGGSKGAQSLNRAWSKILDKVLEHWQVIHISGTLDAGATQARREQMSDEQKSSYKLFPYLHSDEMGLALAAADLVVSRAGASTLGEYPLMGLPAILVPYPFAWRYQKVNADYLVEQGAAVRLDNDRLDQELLATLTSLLGDEGRLAEMQKHALGLARPDAADEIAAQLCEMA
jgi:UDP-N-acetylglucosamine--N-acetylmuramyl-(pentapeptide) pyrophosphoryl-undecaprenol N-acetylglucosamine transferase